jgi:hypothetical protein
MGNKGKTYVQLRSVKQLTSFCAWQNAVNEHMKHRNSKFAAHNTTHMNIQVTIVIYSNKQLNNPVLWSPILHYDIGFRIVQTTTSCDKLTVWHTQPAVRRSEPQMSCS